MGVLASNFNQMTSRLRTTLEDLEAEQEKSERLLLNVLPKAIAERLKRGEENIADSYTEVSVLFADIVGFTILSTKVTPKQLIELLNRIFSAFDALSEKYGLEKIKTIGDAYMVVGGLPTPRDDHAVAIADIALAMQEYVEQFNRETSQGLSIRIGINSGPVVAGIVGTKKFLYDIWGDAVNTAARMESQGIEGRIQVTEATYHHLREKYQFEERGVVDIKGKGEMCVYILKGRKTIVDPMAGPTGIVVNRT
jgi:class 3 adenylate cyclase